MCSSFFLYILRVEFIESMHGKKNLGIIWFVYEANLDKIMCGCAVDREQFRDSRVDRG